MFGTMFGTFFKTGFLLLASVLSFSVNGPGNPNRSGVRTVEIGFSDPTTVPGVGSLLLIDRTTGQTVDISGTSLSGNGTVQLSWNLSSLNLPDGKYIAVLPKDQTSPQIQDDKAFSFHRLAGDVNGDGVVSGNDYVTVNQNIGQIGDSYLPGDANGDGVVSGNDYVFVNQHIGNTL